MRWILIAASILIASPTLAENIYPPTMCADGEDVVVCDLKIQRNNALDELVISDSSRKRETQYWTNYVNGMENQRNQVSVWWELYVKGLEERKESQNANP